MNENESSSDRNLWIAVALCLVVYAVWSSFFGRKTVAPLSVATNLPATETSSTRPPSPRDPTPEIASSVDEATLGDASIRVAPHGAALVGYTFQGPVSSVELVADSAHGLLSTFSDLRFTRDRHSKGLVYRATRPDGISITKEFIPGLGTVLPRLIIVASNPGPRPVQLDNWSLTLGPGLGTVESARKENPKETRVISLAPQAKHIEKMSASSTISDYRWVALENLYFLAAIVPAREQFEPAASPAEGTLSLKAKLVTLKSRGIFTWQVPFYLGPKSHGALEPYGLDLEKSIDYGWFRDIGRPIFRTLAFLQAHLGNWGWSIIVLTLGLQILLLPLTYKSLKAAAAMRILQPEITKLQQRHKDDPTRLNSEMMALYKKAGANPLGGCLPMLAQMPIFIALYNVLKNSWELHGAPWAFWIHDLSAKDPFFVLPVVMGGLMFAQSKLNPPAGDPTQQQMMMFMPLIFTVMFAQASSGLVLYWLTNSLVSTLLQLALRDRLNAAI